MSAATGAAGAAPADASPERTLEGALARLAPRLGAGATGVADLVRLSGGASQETWAFRLTGPEPRDLILRRRPDQARPGKEDLPLATEAAMIRLAAARGVPEPRVLHVLSPDEGAGEGFVMTRVEGETIGPKILKAPELESAREKFAPQCGRILAAIHAIEPGDIALETRTAESTLKKMVDDHAEFGQDRPVFELALRWLRENMPETPPLRLCHGDFRLGNLMMDETGVNAVLDWEGCHIGDPHADLAWLCVGSWRFGGEQPVGGMGPREELWEAYEAAGGGWVDRHAARWWEVAGNLRWGVIIEWMGGWIRAGADPSVERHVIARRASEIELLLLADLTGREI